MNEIELDNTLPVYEEQGTRGKEQENTYDPENTLVSSAEVEETSADAATPPLGGDGEGLPVGKKLMRSLVSDDDDDDEADITFRQLLDLAPQWFLSQWKMLLLCLAGIFLYITSGYQAQVEMMKETELEAELKDWRYRSITRVSELTQLCRQSQLEQKLREQGDSTLIPSPEAPFIIEVKE